MPLEKLPEMKKRPSQYHWVPPHCPLHFPWHPQLTTFIFSPWISFFDFSDLYGPWLSARTPSHPPLPGALSMSTEHVLWSFSDSLRLSAAFSNLVATKVNRHLTCLHGPASEVGQLPCQSFRLLFRLPQNGIWPPRSVRSYEMDFERRNTENNFRSNSLCSVPLMYCFEAPSFLPSPSREVLPGWWAASTSCSSVSLSNLSRSNGQRNNTPSCVAASPVLFHFHFAFLLLPWIGTSQIKHYHLSLASGSIF